MFVKSPLSQSDFSPSLLSEITLLMFLYLLPGGDVKWMPEVASGDTIVSPGADVSVSIRAITPGAQHHPLSRPGCEVFTNIFISSLIPSYHYHAS